MRDPGGREKARVAGEQAGGARQERPAALCFLSHIREPLSTGNRRRIGAGSGVVRSHRSGCCEEWCEGKMEEACGADAGSKRGTLAGDTGRLREMLCWVGEKRTSSANF